MARNLVTIEEWNALRIWARRKGYKSLPELPRTAAGFGPKDPATEITVREVAAWCNAKSEMEGLEPCYTMEGKVFKSDKLFGHGITRYMDWNRKANGYRLATQKEWLLAMKGKKSISAQVEKKSFATTDEHPNSFGIRDINNCIEWVWELA